MSNLNATINGWLLQIGAFLDKNGMYFFIFFQLFAMTAILCESWKKPRPVFYLACGAVLSNVVGLLAVGELQLLCFTILVACMIPWLMFQLAIPD